MLREPLRSLVHNIRCLVSAPRGAEDGDGQLLERFLTRNDQTAFETLLHRHGPSVLSLCRRLLRDTHLAEDAFQATFLVLARKAGSIARRSSVGSWLYGVAYRVALKARAQTLRRQTHERQLAAMTAADPSYQESHSDVQPILDEEINRLPEKYRAPVLLCYLEGKTKEEAARQLGWTRGSVQGRLERAREKLRLRLARRGVTLTSAALVALLSENAAPAAVAPALFNLTLQAALRVAAGQAAASGVSVVVAGWAEGVIRDMFLTKLKLVAMLLLTFGLLGAGLWAHQVLAGKPQPPEKDLPAAKVKEAPPEKEAPVEKVKEHKDLIGDPLPPGALARLGSIRFWGGSYGATVAFSPDGKLLAAGGRDFDETIHLWDFKTGARLRQLKGTAVAFAPDNKRLASAGSVVRIWDVSTGQELLRLGVRARGVAFSRDGKLLASGDSFEGARLWDSSTGKELRAFPAGGGQVAFSTDGKLLASGNNKDGKIRLWEVETGKEVRILEGGRDGSGFEAVALAFSPDGKLLATASNNDTIRIWDVRTGKEQRHWGNAGGNVLSLAFSPNSKSLVSIGRDNAVRLWEVSTGKQRHEWFAMYLDPGASVSASFSPNGKLLASGTSRRIPIWDMKTFAELYPGHETGIGLVKFLQGEKTIVSSAQDLTLRFWNSANGKELRALPPGARSLAVSPDGKLLAAGGQSGPVRPLGPNKETIRLLDIKTGQVVRELPGGGDLLQFLPDGKTLAAVALSYGGYERINDPQGKGYHRVDVVHGHLHLWDIKSGKEIRQVYLTKFCYGMAFTEDGETLAVQEWEGTTQLWNVSKGQKLHKFPVKGRGLLFSRDGKTLLTRTTWGNNGYVKQKLATYFYEVATGKKRFEINGVGHTIALSPNGKMLAALDEDDIKTINLIEIPTGKKRRQLTGHEDKVTALAFSDSGKKLASGSEDTTVLVWNVLGQAKEEQGQPAEQEEGGKKPGQGAPAKTLKGHKEKVTTVAFDSDGKAIASGGDEGVVMLWDAATGGNLAKLSRGKSDDAEISSLVFAPFGPYGKSLLVGRWNGTLQYWNIFDSGETRGVERQSYRAKGAVLSVAYSKVGNMVATGDYEKRVNLFRGITPTILAGHSDKVYSVAFTPDGKTLVSGSGDKTVMVWNLASLKPRLALRTHTSAVRSVACSADSKLLASAGADGTVRLWDLTAEGPKETAVLKDHKGEVFCVAFSPDGKTMASAGADTTVRLWKVNGMKAQLQTVLRGHKGEVLSVAFSPDGKMLVSGGADATVRLWDLTAQK
jgi:RNA polymerase sigma factor (sigma-70 family)